jgi:hypothetical protein
MAKFQENREYVTTGQASKISGLSAAYFTHLLREGILEGYQLAHNWVIYKDSLDRFLATPRKPGPRGPRKKTKNK